MSEPRIASPDVLRGVAILGTFASNAWIFADPGGPAAVLSGAYFSSAGALETVLRSVSNGKFLALLTLLFGVGTELQYQSALRRGTPWPGRYPVRAAVLFVEGLLHYLLVFEFDVLMAYAVTSVLVAYLVGRSDRAVRIWMAAVGGFFTAVLLAITAQLAATPDAPMAVAATAPATWADRLSVRVEQFALYRVEVPIIVLSATVLFLAGSRLLRAGAFDDSPVGVRIRRRLVVLGLGFGAPLNLLAAFAGPDWFLVDRYLLPPFVALGLLGLVTSLVLRYRGGRIRSGLANVGRTALSCYVLQNVLGSILCYAWGLDLADRFTDARPYWVVGLWAGVSVLLVLAATAWLRRFDRGPLELAMHAVIVPRWGSSLIDRP